jgi:hypothetical protein
VGAAFRGGGRQLAVREGHTRRRGARVVVEAIGEGLERAVCGVLAMVSKVAQGW